MKTVTNRELRALDPIERVALLMHAIARDDDVELDRLWATCRRVIVEKPDIDTLHVFDRVKWTVAVVTVELTGPLARLDLLASLRRPLHDDDNGLLDILQDRVMSAYLTAHIRAMGAEDEDDDDDRVSSDATIAADTALRFLHDVLDALIQHDANRIATTMRAFEDWSDFTGFDPATLLAALAPWIARHLELHAEILERAEIDALAAQELASQLQIKNRYNH